tara:strand:- start:341 stop:877 length:537 start_codon:yes stop_codon:yes gene_type:complete
MKNMADYTMDEEKWNARVNLIESDLSTNDRGSMEAVLRWNMETGTTDVENRKRYWTNISNLYATVDNSPIKFGKQSTLPQVVQDSLATLKAIYAEGHTALFATHPLFGDVESKRGAYSAPYGDSESYVSAMVSLFSDRMTSYYTNHRDNVADKKQWDGTLNKKGLPTIVIPEKMEVEG